MNTFTSEEREACRKLIELALREDLGDAGDRTSQALIPEDLTGQAVFVARREGVLAGLPVLPLLLEHFPPRLDLRELARDGDRVRPGTELARLTGSMRSILAAERTALNFLQHLSGVATLARRYVDAVAGTRARILDTRKTTPGWRLREKYAVRQGGAANHRLGLYDGVLIKDNHLAALGDVPDPLAAAVERARAAVGRDLPVEIEVDTLDQLDRVLPLSPDIVLLDNMTPDQLREAVRRRDALAPRTLLEASGGVSLETARAIAESGVDRISVGALTHSAPALDIGLDYLR